ncbi:MAG: DUF445 family protein, partial [Bacillota bacterium]
AVGNQLLTTEDLQNILLSEEIKVKVIDNIVNALQKTSETQNLKSLCLKFSGEDKTKKIEIGLTDLVTERLLFNLQKIRPGDLIADLGSQVVTEKLKGSFFANFISSEKIASMVAPIGGQIDDYIAENGKQILRPLVAAEISGLSERPLTEITANLGFEEEQLRLLLEKIYDDFIGKQITKILEDLHISEIVSKKINDMDVAEIEKLVLSVMQRELRAIINLGALIGFVIGILMIFF